MLMPVSALPGAYGIGCFSKEAYEFVDMLKEAGQKLDRRDTVIHRISLFQHLRETRILSIWRR